MENSNVSEESNKETTSPDAHRSYARRGAIIGCLLGLLVVWRIMSSAIDQTVTDHSPMFPAAVMMICIFAAFVLLVMTVAGLAIGARIKRTPNQRQA